MAATLEIKYYNSFWAKKIDTIVEVEDTVGVLDVEATETIIELVDANPNVGVGQTVYWDGAPSPSPVVIRVISSTEFELNMVVTIPIATDIVFGPITDFSYIPNAYEYSDEKDWYLEEARIRGGYNNTIVDLGVRAYIVEQSIQQQNILSGLIYSGLFNSRTGVNATNEFSVGQDITRSLDPYNGSIQKLYAEDTDLIIFQELKVSSALIDKDAVYTAEGMPLTSSSNLVIGQVRQYGGNYGIGTNPESFAVYGYRKYFVDKRQNAVLRLSQDGITEISTYGMCDYFRDNLSLITNTGKILGSWDMHNKQYVLSIQPTDSDYYQTLSFDEDSTGWTSMFTFEPNYAGSLKNNFYTVFEGNIWKHYSTNVPYCNFYGVQELSTVTLAINPNPSYPKTFQTVNYEGSPGWSLTSIYTDSNTGVPITSATSSVNLTLLENQLFLNNFKSKENKYYGNLLNITPPSEGTVVYGQSVSGLTGFYMIGTLTFPDIMQPGVTYTKLAELFAVSSTFSTTGNG
tara:strand:+ start:3369 stop:4913 length:1545 start_codon:yes stop_codon:yes gene_type:complete